MEKVDGIGKVLVNSIINSKAQSKAVEELQFIEEHEIQHLFYGDKNYPNRLKQCEDASLNLYFKGNVNWESNFVSIVGTRKASVSAKLFTEKLVKELAPYDPVIVSGLAQGIDIAAHKAALQYGLKTVAVFAHGLDKVYPSTYTAIAKQISKNGCLLTDYMSKTVALPQNFVSKQNSCGACGCYYSYWKSY